MASSSSLLFDPRDQESLFARRELEIDGNRARVSRRRLENRYIESTDAATSVFSDVDTAITSSSPIDANDQIDSQTVTVPVNFECPEFLEFVGFNPLTASMLYQRWRNMDTTLLDLREGLFEFAYDWVEDMTGRDVTSEDDDWNAYLSHIGLDTTIKDAIMDPTMIDIRLTASGKFWVQTTMQDKWAYLKGAQQRSQQRASGQNFDFAVGSGFIPPATGAPAGSTVLWKGVATSRAEKMFEGLHRQGPIDLHQVVTWGAGDFHRSGPLYYFTTQVETAQRFARFARNRNRPVSACLVRIEVPNAVLESYPTYALNFPSEEFKEVVWNSRRGRRLPKSLSHISQAQLLVGEICTSIDRSFHAMQQYSEIDEGNILKVTIDGVERRARQHACRDELAEKIEETCVDTTQLREWESPDEALP